MQYRFVAGFAPIVRDVAASRAFFEGRLGIALQGSPEYPNTDDVPGLRHFGLWSLADAADACFGVREWPADRPIPQGSFEVDVDSHDAVAVAAAELKAAGYALLHPARLEPWGQTVARLQTPEGLIDGVAFTPWLHTPAAEG